MHTRHLDRRTVRVIPIYPPKTWFVCRDLTNKPNLCMTMRQGIKFVRIIGVFEFTRVTCRPLLTFGVQVKLDSIN